MGRPRKNADWFRHQNNLKNDACVLALRKKFRNNGVIRNFVPPKFRNLKPPEIGKVK